MEVSYERFSQFLKYLEPKIKHDGSVGLQQAINEFWKGEFTATIDVMEQVTGRLHATGRYLVEKGEGTGNMLIRRNPIYKNQWLHDFKLALISAGLALLVGIILWLIDNRSKHQEMLQIQQQVKKVSDRLDSLQLKK